MAKRGIRLGRELLRRLRMSSNSLPFHSGDPLPLSYSSSVTSSSTSSSSFSPAFFGLLSASVLGMMELAHADAAEGEGDMGIPVASSPNSEANDMERLVRQERQRLEELLQTANVRRESFPAFIVSARGQKITVKFCVPASCEVSRLIVDLVSHLGVKNEKHGGGSEMLVRAWDSAISWQMTLNYAEESTGDGKRDTGNLCILIYESLVSSGNCEIEFIKDGTFTSSEVDALVSVLKLAREKNDAKKTLGKKQQGSMREKQSDPQMERVISSLESMGVRVYGIDGVHGSSSSGDISWDTIAGYEEQKREIEDTVLLSLMSPQVYDGIAWGTRCKFESNRPRAVLFEGPPGTGKTSCARVIANQAGVPLLYVPLEIVVSKYYGESERLLGKVFSLANDLPDGAIIFLDEIDSFAASRDSEIHEATRRMLSVLLRQIDGFEREKKVIVIAATNRKQDLDPALISRFDTMIPFHLPDRKNREKIASQYAKHLKQSEITLLADATEGMSGRDIRDVCQQAERHWAAKLIREQTTSESVNIQLPSLEEYVKCAEIRSRTLVELNEERRRMISSSPRDQGLLGLL